MQNNNPCYKCKNRDSTCHATCPAYNDFAQKREIERNEAQKRKDAVSLAYQDSFNARKNMKTKKSALSYKCMTISGRRRKDG